MRSEFPTLPDFSRQTWSSARAQAVWGPRINAASKAWLELEIRSVIAGLRRNALIFGRNMAEDCGLPFVAIRGEADRFAVGRDPFALAHFLQCGDNAAVGSLLGFPDCCQHFFDSTWGDGGLDTTWEMAANGPISGPIECNILGRWLGIRWVTHLPCSFNCEHTLAIGKAMRELMYSIDRVSAETIDEVLSWPVEWSALHGIAEIKYPVVKVSTRSTYTPGKQVVQREGTKYPAEGARGINFPYRTDVPSVKPLAFLRPSYKLNGFSSLEAMNTAHHMVMLALIDNEPKGTVLDLGCGDGTLMESIRKVYGVPTVGIELDNTKGMENPHIIHANLNNIKQLDLPSIDTAIVSIQRFKEIEWLESWCTSHARKTLVYSYDEPMFARCR